jgi:hypothetical protein
MDLKKASMSDCTQPPPSSTMAMTLPPVWLAGQSYAVHRAGTVHVPSPAPAAWALMEDLFLSL